MSTFDSFFLGGIVIGIAILIVSLTLQGTSLPKGKRLIVSIAIIVVMIVGSIILAKYYGWQSSILGIPDSEDTGSDIVSPTNMPSHVESDSPPPLTQDAESESEQPTTTMSPTQEPQGQALTIEDIFAETYETHSPNDSITSMVSFREWNSSTDSDLRGETF